MDYNIKALSVGISIPVLNERDQIVPFLTDVITVLDQANYTICLVDHGSNDGTLDLIQQFMAKNARIKLIKAEKKHYGCQRGAATRLGLEFLVEQTMHPVFVDLDADGSQRPAELINGIRQVSDLDYDVAIASKYVFGSKVIGRPLSRRFISIFYNLLARFLFDKRIRDYSNSYRFYTREAATYLLTAEAKYTSPVYLLEMLVKWIEHYFKIIEIPTIYIERNSGRSKVKVVDLIKGFLGTLDLALWFYQKRMASKK
jgi:dolichol-phosphate mannosyltransferase